jgi:hypothetical protein
MSAIAVGVGVNPYETMMKSSSNFIVFICGVFDPVVAIFKKLA